MSANKTTSSRLAVAAVLLAAFTGVDAHYFKCSNIPENSVPQISCVDVCNKAVSKYNSLYTTDFDALKDAFCNQGALDACSDCLKETNTANWNAYNQYAGDIFKLCNKKNECKDKNSFSSAVVQSEPAKNTFSQPAEFNTALSIESVSSSPASFASANSDTIVYPQYSTSIYYKSGSIVTDIETAYVTVCTRCEEEKSKASLAVPTGSFSSNDTPFNSGSVSSQSATAASLKPVAVTSAPSVSIGSESVVVPQYKTSIYYESGSIVTDIQTAYVTICTRCTENKTKPVVIASNPVSSPVAVDSTSPAPSSVVKATSEPSAVVVASSSSAVPTFEKSIDVSKSTVSESNPTTIDAKFSSSVPAASSNPVSDSKPVASESVITSQSASKSVELTTSYLVQSSTQLVPQTTSTETFLTVITQSVPGKTTHEVVTLTVTYCPPETTVVPVTSQIVKTKEIHSEDYKPSNTGSNSFTQPVVPPAGRVNSESQPAVGTSTMLKPEAVTSSIAVSSPAASTPVASSSQPVIPPPAREISSESKPAVGTSTLLKPEAVTSSNGVSSPALSKPASTTILVPQTTSTSTYLTVVTQSVPGKTTHEVITLTVTYCPPGTTVVPVTEASSLASSNSAASSTQPVIPPPAREISSESKPAVGTSTMLKPEGITSSSIASSPASSNPVVSSSQPVIPPPAKEVSSESKPAVGTSTMLKPEGVTSSIALSSPAPSNPVASSTQPVIPPPAREISSESKPAVGTSTLLKPEAVTSNVVSSPASTTIGESTIVAVVSTIFESGSIVVDIKTDYVTFCPKCTESLSSAPVPTDKQAISSVPSLPVSSLAVSSVSTSDSVVSTPAAPTSVMPVPTTVGESTVIPVLSTVYESGSIVVDVKTNFITFCTECTTSSNPVSTASSTLEKEVPVESTPVENIPESSKPVESQPTSETVNVVQSQPTPENSKSVQSQPSSETLKPVQSKSVETTPSSGPIESSSHFYFTSIASSASNSPIVSTGVIPIPTPSSPIAQTNGASSIRSSMVGVAIAGLIGVLIM